MYYSLIQKPPLYYLKATWLYKKKKKKRGEGQKGRKERNEIKLQRTNKELTEAGGWRRNTEKEEAMERHRIRPRP